MGDETSTGTVMTPPQPGVITREGENFPYIPPKLLEMSPEELQKKIERLHRRIDFNQERIIPDLKLEEKLEHNLMLYTFAKVAVERQRAMTKGKERSE